MDRKKILIIEDERELVSALFTFLKPQGFEIVAAYDAMFGVKLTHKENVDLVILDMALPAGGGMFVLENIRENPSTCTLPVIVLTARTETEIETKAKKLGVTAFFHKPFDPQEVLKTIKKALMMG